MQPINSNKQALYHVHVQIDGYWHVISAVPVTMPTALSMIESRKKIKLKTENVHYERVENEPSDAK